MKLIIPMAGRGTRLRPHTHTTPKPLLPIAGTMMVERIVDTFSRTLNQDIEEIAFVLGDFGKEVEQKLSDMARRFNAKPSIYYQKTAMGTADAVYCAADSMQGEIIVAFADTLFETAGKVEISDTDAVIWLKEVENPSSFGVAKMEGNRITGFVEKPTEPVSNLAIIGVYYFRKGEDLRAELAHIINNDLKSERGEYELTAAIDALLEKGNVFKPATVDTWLDCGTIRSWIDTTNQVLSGDAATPLDKISHEGCTIHPPVFIGDNVTLRHSTIGPNVAIESNAIVEQTTVEDSIINNNASVKGCELKNSSIGSFARVNAYSGSLHVGDHSIVGE
ncbi:MAG: NTP transferase domain-containing protein [Balneolia bacterium]|nr:NTP transferase domain-containing protein [Balneolia bacterium]